MNWDSPEIAALFRAALDEDLGFGRSPRPGDLTALATVPAEATANAQVIAKQELILAGLPLAERVFRALDSRVSIAAAASDGDSVTPKAAVLRIEGNARVILSAERTALNFLAHLSGIATLTRRFLDAIADTGATIRDTRKTTPLHRALEKYAVRVGGGANHRFGLFDAVLIKENHIAAAGGVAAAVRRAQDHVASLEPLTAATTAYEAVGQQRESYPVIPAIAVQVEVRDERELREALAAGAGSVLLDNQSPQSAAALVRVARQLQPACIVEVSGGITLENARAFAEAGPDFLAIGALTHSAPAADFTLLVEPPSVR